MLNKFFHELLKTPAGKFSRKSFMIIVSFLITMKIGLWIVISDAVLNKPVTNISLDVFNSLLIFVGSLASISVADKKLQSKNGEKPKDEEDGTEI